MTFVIEDERFKGIHLRFHRISHDLGNVLLKIFRGFSTSDKDILKEALADVKEIEENLRETVLEILNVMKEEGETENTKFMVSFSTKLEMIKNSVSRIAQRALEKVDAGILFSEKAVSELNYLLSETATLLGDTADLALTLNKSLAKTMEERAKEIIRAANNYAIKHEERLICGICIPKSAPIYLDLIDSIKALSNHCIDISQRI